MLKNVIQLLIRIFSKDNADVINRVVEIYQFSNLYEKNSIVFFKDHRQNGFSS